MKKQFDITVLTKSDGEIVCTVYVDGLFMYKNNVSLFESVKKFVTDFVDNKHDFNECYGAYRFCISQKEKDKEICFADNSGMMRFYINQGDNKLFSSLADAIPKEERKINYSAVAQLLAFGCIYNEHTIVDSVVFSDPNSYYILENGCLIEETKHLKEVSEYRNENLTLNSLIQKALLHCEGKVGCTITGGIDSRSVLANLISLGVKPELAITGHELQPDVEIAKEISRVVGLNLSIISDDIEEKDWLSQCVEAADGQEGICEIYRLNKLARYLHNQGIELQFGGVNGEMYKNSFINQDFPVYFGRPRWERFFKYKVGTYDLDLSMFTKRMQEEFIKVPSEITEWLKTHKGNNKAEAYLNAGYEIMQARCNHVINMIEKHTTIYNPLMERKMVAYAYGKNPYRLEMQSFQRHEVSTYCKDIKNIKTDRELTCNEDRKGVEFIKSNLFLIKVALKRLLFRSKIDIRIDKCYESGHKDKYFNMALDNTKKLGIIIPNYDTGKIPAGLADRLFMIGLFFNTID